MDVMTTEEMMLISAERYALGRRNYVVDETIRYLRMRLPTLSEPCKRNLIYDISTASKYGSEEDHEKWSELLDVLRENTKEN